MQENKHEAIRPEHDAVGETHARWERPSLQRLGAALAEDHFGIVADALVLPS